MKKEITLVEHVYLNYRRTKKLIHLLVSSHCIYVL